MIGMSHVKFFVHWSKTWFEHKNTLIAKVFLLTRSYSSIFDVITSADSSGSQQISSKAYKAYKEVDNILFDSKTYSY